MSTTIRGRFKFRKRSVVPLYCVFVLISDCPLHLDPFSRKCKKNRVHRHALISLGGINLEWHQNVDKSETELEKKSTH